MAAGFLMLALREGGPLMVAVAASVFVILRLRTLTAKVQGLSAALAKHDEICHQRDRTAAVERERVAGQISHLQESATEMKGQLKELEKSVYELQRGN